MEKKLRLLTKLDKRNTTTLKNFDDDALSLNYTVIANFQIDNQFGTICEPDSRCIVHSLHIFLNNNHLCNRN